jgi:hypothetical protein
MKDLVIYIADPLSITRKRWRLPRSVGATPPSSSCVWQPTTRAGVIGTRRGGWPTLAFTVARCRCRHGTQRHPRDRLTGFGGSLARLRLRRRSTRQLCCRRTVPCRVLAGCSTPAERRARGLSFIIGRVVAPPRRERRGACSPSRRKRPRTVCPVAAWRYIGESATPAASCKGLDAQGPRRSSSSQTAWTIRDAAEALRW